VPRLMHVRTAFDRLYWDLYYDPETLCPHDGSTWALADGLKRCGQCGRRMRLAEVPTEAA
jgi:hypothetical protein